MAVKTLKPKNIKKNLSISFKKRSPNYAKHKEGSQQSVYESGKAGSGGKAKASS